MSNTPFPASLFIADKTSCSIITAFESSFVNARLSLITANAALAFSTRTASLAPRINASMPIAPLPAYKSRNLHPAISDCNILKRVSLILSVVGLVLSPSAALRGRLRAVPAITLILIIPFPIFLFEKIL